MNNENKSKSLPHAELIKAWADGAKIQSRVLINFDNVEQWSKWTNDDEPEWWNEICQFRIKPKKKKPTNEPWKPQSGEKYWFIGVDFTPEYDIWRDDSFDKRNFKYGNCFQTMEEVQAAIPRVEAALKGGPKKGKNTSST